MRKFNKGRKKTDLSKKPAFQITTLQIKANEHFGPQLLQARLFMGFTGSAVARSIGWHESNITHFEKGESLMGNGIQTAFKYAKAIGIKKLVFILDGICIGK